MVIARIVQLFINIKHIPTCQAALKLGALKQPWWVALALVSLPLSVVLSTAGGADCDSWSTSCVVPPDLLGPSETCCMWVSPGSQLLDAVKFLTLTLWFLSAAQKLRILDKSSILGSQHSSRSWGKRLRLASCCRNVVLFCSAWSRGHFLLFTWLNFWVEKLITS